MAILSSSATPTNAIFAKEFGFHAKKENPIQNTIYKVKDEGFRTFQIFLTNPKSYASVKESDEQLESFKENLKKNKMTCFIHAPYIINLSNPALVEKSKEVLLDQLIACNKMGANGLVIHVGKDTQKNYHNSLNLFITSIKSVINKLQIQGFKKSKIYIETPAGQGSEILQSSKEHFFETLSNSFSEKEKKHLGICIDTCHIFASGMCNLTNINSVKDFCDYYKKYRKEFDFLIHLNDSKKPFNSHLDRHEDIDYGHIKKDGLKEFVRQSKNLNFILETPAEHISYVEQVKLVAW